MTKSARPDPLANPRLMIFLGFGTGVTFGGAMLAADALGWTDGVAGLQTPWVTAVLATVMGVTFPLVWRAQMRARLRAQGLGGQAPLEARLYSRRDMALALALAPLPPAGLLGLLQWAATGDAVAGAAFAAVAAGYGYVLAVLFALPLVLILQRKGPLRRPRLAAAAGIGAALAAGPFGFAAFAMPVLLLPGTFSLLLGALAGVGFWLALPRLARTVADM